MKRVIILIGASLLLLVSCGADPGDSSYESDADAAQGWYDDNGYLLEAITDDMDTITEAATIGDIYGVGDACDDLGDHVADAKSADPMPFEDVDASWQDALDDYEEGAFLCSSAVDRLDPDTLERSIEHFDSATENIIDATSALERRVG